VKLTGTTSLFNGELEINATDVEKIGTSELPLPLNVAPAGVNESNQGQLVRLAKVTVTDIHRVDSYGTTEMTATKDGKSVVIRLDNRTGTTFDEFPYQEGSVLNIVGISSQFKGTYQVKPRSIDDFAVADIQAPVTSIDLHGYKLSDGSYLGSVGVSLYATDDRSGVAKTEYSINDGDWQLYKAPFTISADGLTTVKYYSEDNEENVEKTQSFNVSVTALSFGNLYKMIESADITPQGLKTAVKAHVQSAERANRGADREKHLQDALTFVENISDKHINSASKEDLKAFISAMLNK